MKLTINGFFKLGIVVSIFLVSLSIAYHFMIDLPSREDKKNAEIQMTETKDAMERASVKAQYQHCLGDVQLLYDENWSRACHTNAIRIKKGNENCLATGISKTMCLANWGEPNDSPNCSLPALTAKDLNEEKEKATDRCLQEMKAGITGSNYNVPALPTQLHELSNIGTSPQELAACVILSGKEYNIPAAVLIGIMKVEGGHVGSESEADSKGAFAIGPMQIKSNLLPELSHTWNVGEDTAHAWVRDNGCVNVHVAAWYLRQKMDKAGSLWGGIAAYHSDDDKSDEQYAKKVIAEMDKQGLVKHDIPLPNDKN